MKRTKLIASLMMCVFCLSFLVVGVFAAVSTAKLNINGNLKYYPEGVFVELSGQVYRGSSTENMQPITSDPRFSYGPVSNFDGTPDATSGNFPLETWNIGNISFIPTQKYIKISVTITNYSDFAIMGTPNITIDNADISSNTNFKVTPPDNISYIASLQTVTADIIIEVLATEEVTGALSVSFEFKEFSVKNFLTWVETSSIYETGYWTLTMGEYEDPTTHEITPLVWRMVLKEEGSNVISVENYTQETELSGSYYFLLDTFIKNVFNCSFENYYDSYGSYDRFDGYGSAVYANDYAVSNIREYLIGVNVYRGSSTANNQANPEFATGQEKEENFLDVFNIKNSPVYNLIEGRTLTDLYPRMSVTTTGEPVEFDTDVKNGVNGIAGIDPDTTRDKFWLLSCYEASVVNVEARSWGDGYYWQRSPSGSYGATLVSSSGEVNPSTTMEMLFTENAARPAFKISF